MKENVAKFLAWIVLIIAFFAFLGFIFLIIRGTFINTSDAMNGYCQNLFGKEYNFQGLGKCQYVNYDTGIKYERFFNISLYREKCPYPKYSNLTHWKVQCNYEN